MIPRVSLAELGDQSWYLTWARDALTRFLQTMITRPRPYGGSQRTLRRSDS